MGQKICGECKQECEAGWQDVGIGPYEYRSAKGVDVQWMYLSDCCEGRVFSDSECLVLFTPSDSPYDRIGQIEYMDR